MSDEPPIHLEVVYGIKRFDARKAYYDALLDTEMRRFNAMVDGSLMALLNPPTRRSIIPQTRTGNVILFPPKDHP